MKKRRITYGVTGMMEYQAIIRIGRSHMKVQFADGSATGYGMNPAMYTTENMMVQKAIENSEQFKRGRIYIVDAVELEEEVKVIRNPGKSDTDVSDHSDTSALTEVETALTEDVTALTEVEFDNNDDAKDYLEREFGCVRSKLRNRADIVAAGEANGVSIIFI